MRLSALASLTLAATGCAGSAMPPTAPYALPDTPFGSWSEVLASGEHVQLTTLVTGHQTYTLGDTAPKIERERRKDTVEILVMAHLVQHPTQGAWLIDSGLGAAFAEEPYGDIRGLGARVALEPFEQEPGEALGTQLAELGIEPSGVFFTHLHLDHTAGVPDLPGDIRYVAAQGEEPTSVKGLVSHDHLASVELLELIDLQALPTIDGWPAADLFGDGSLWALPSVGHSPGHMSFLALTDPAPTLLTGDAAHIELNWTETLAPGFSDDPEQAVQAIEDLQGIHDDLGQPELIFGHGL